MRGLPSFARQTAIVHRRAPADRYGDRGAAELVPVERCILHPVSGTEDTDRAQRTVTRYVLIGPKAEALLTLAARDAIEVESQTYEVDAQPEVWLRHVRVVLRRVEG